MKSNQMKRQHRREKINSSNLPLIATTKTTEAAAATKQQQCHTKIYFIYVYSNVKRVAT